MAKVTETTSKVERSFTLEVNEEELQVLKALLSRTTYDGPCCADLWDSIESVTGEAATHDITLTGSAISALYKVVKL